jgi:hypothetical protein
MKIWNKREKGVPLDAVYIGRPSKWGNPFKIGDFYGGKILNREDCIFIYESWLENSDIGYNLLKDISELKDKDLVCWCKPLPCHGDILLELANKE